MSTYVQVSTEICNGHNSFSFIVVKQVQNFKPVALFPLPFKILLYLVFFISGGMGVLVTTQNGSQGIEYNHYMERVKQDILK